MTVLQLAIAELHAKACKKCLGNGWLGGRHLVKIAGRDHCQEIGRRCDDCGGKGIVQC